MTFGSLIFRIASISIIATVASCGSFHPPYQSTALERTVSLQEVVKQKAISNSLTASADSILTIAKQKNAEGELESILPSLSYAESIYSMAILQEEKRENTARGESLKEDMHTVEQELDKYQRLLKSLEAKW